MNFIVILIILFLVWLLFGNRIKAWFAGFLARLVEDRIRKATGMPPRPDSREAKRQQRAQQQARQKNSQSADSAKGAYGSRAYSSTGQRRKRKASSFNLNEPLIPKEYAEDVEFVESISYSDTIIGATDSRGTRTVYHESQVSDVEWEEITISDKQKNKSR